MENTKKKWYKKWWIWVIIVVIILAFLPSSSDADVNANDSTGSNDATSQESTESTESNKDETKVSYNYGDLVTADNSTSFNLQEGIEFTIVSQTVYTKEEIAAENPFNNDANAVAEVVVKIENNSSESLDFNTINFSSVSAGGVSSTWGDSVTVLPSSEKALSAGTLMPGNSIQGYVEFPVADDDSIATLKYNGVKNSFEVEIPKP